MIHRFSFPTTIHFGPGARRLVAEHLKAQGVRRPLVVTDRGIAPLPLLAEFIGGLEGLEVAVYSDGTASAAITPTTPTIAAATRATARRRLSAASTSCRV